MKKENTTIVLLQNLAVPLAIIVAWLVCGYLGKINEALLPALPKTLKTAVELITSGKLEEDVLVSLGRVFKGFAVGALLGMITGTLMGLCKPIYNLLNSIVSILRPIPMMALIPLFILWLGIGETCKVSLIALGSFWSVLLNTIQGIHSVDPKLLEVARVLEKDKRTVFIQIYLPAAVPAIITGLRLGMGVAWSCVVAAEMMAASSGVGYMLMFARTMSQPDRLMVGVFAIGLIGLAIDKIMLFIQKKVSWWK